MDYQTPALRIARSLVKMEVLHAALVEKNPHSYDVRAVSIAMRDHHLMLRKALDDCAGALGLDVAILLSAGGK